MWSALVVLVVLRNRKEIKRIEAFDMAAIKKNRFFIIGLIIIIAGLAFYAKYQGGRADEAEANLPSEAAKVIDVKFAKTTTLRVATISGKIIVRADDPGFAGLLSSSQTQKLPFSADYFVELGKVNINNYRWLEAEKTMIIEIPDVTLSRPNVDEASQIASRSKGIIVTREAASRLQQQLSSRAVNAANAEAKKPANLEKARDSARKAVQNIISAPLQAAGFGRIKVLTRFPWERRGLVAERWDESKPLSEIIRSLEES